ncbi:MAG TPA: hypothetical protein VGH93_08190 [Solirubrobacteraceae bacterium]
MAAQRPALCIPPASPAGTLTEDQGVLGMGPMGERVFGRRHFIDVVAAFSSPMLPRPPE